MLDILAGPSAYRHIQQHGLQPEHIHSVFGASGAAKWLSIAGLDHAIFSRWLNRSGQPIHLFGTSVGAWKLAAAAKNDPARALEQLAQAYINQHYGDSAKHQDIIRETNRIIDICLSADDVNEILANPRYFLNFGAVRCNGLMARENKAALAAALGKASLVNRRGRHGLHKTFTRIIFSDPRTRPPVQVKDGYQTEILPLNSSNFHRALTAAGSIPYVMPGVDNIPHTPAGMYRDGGLLDYHPVPHYFWQNQGIVLYPHFYRHLIPGWFDKLIRNKFATADELDNVVLIAPSEKFVASLPGQQIPDRQDFNKFFKRDQERQARWQVALEKSFQLGELFLNAVDSGDIARMTKPL